MSSAKARVIAAAEEIDAQWLSIVLGISVQDFQIEEIVDEGYASRMYRVHLVHDDPLLDSSIIIKLATIRPELADLAEDTLFREVYFYKDIGADMQGIVPKMYFADVDVPNRQLTLVMEDLGDLPHKPFSDNLENSCAAVKALAKVHAMFWESERLNSPVYEAAELQIDFDEMHRVCLESLEVEKSADYSFPYLARYVHHVVQLLPWLIEELSHPRGATTLVHGDFHTRNVHVEDGRATLFDWQQAEKGLPARDIVYWFLLCVEVDDIEDFEPTIAQTYVTALKNEGINDYTMKEFQRTSLDVASTMVTRIFCFQVLLEMSQRDAPYLEKMLARADKMARRYHLLALIRIARVLVPPVITVLRWLGLRSSRLSLKT